MSEEKLTELCGLMECFKLSELRLRRRLALRGVAGWACFLAATGGLELRLLPEDPEDVDDPDGPDDADDAEDAEDEEDLRRPLLLRRPTGALADRLAAMAPSSGPVQTRHRSSFIAEQWTRGISGPRVMYWRGVDRLSLSDPARFVSKQKRGLVDGAGHGN